MKKGLLLASVLMMFSCQEKRKMEPITHKKGERMELKKEKSKTVFGDSIATKKILSSGQMLAKYQSMKLGDSIAVTFEAKINTVCKKKGCWVKLALNDSIQNMTKMKDYAFFLPMDSDGKMAIVQGKAFVSEMTVEQRKHYAEDAGDSPEKIAKIKEPKVTYQFLANGVILK